MWLEVVNRVADPLWLSRDTSLRDAVSCSSTARAPPPPPARFAFTLNRHHPLPQPHAALTQALPLMAIQIPLFVKGGALHSYVLSYRGGIPASATGLSIHQGWFYGVGSGTRARAAAQSTARSGCEEYRAL